MTPAGAVARAAVLVLLSWLATVAASFVLIRAMPGDPVALFLAAGNVRPDPAIIAAYRASWGIDGPLALQFLRWLGGFLTLDWGVSYETGRPVLEDLAARLPWSAAIGIGGMALAILAGGALGFAAACRPGGIADRASRALAIGGQALPAFAVGLVLLWVLSAQLRLISPFGGGWAERLVLPVLLVAAFSTGSLARLVHAGFAEVRESAFYRTALAKGRSRRAALWHHGAGHAAMTLAAGIAPDLAWIVGGTVIAEIVFGVPGVSERMVQAVAARDYAILHVFVALVALWVVTVLQGAGQLRRALDPRLA